MSDTPIRDQTVVDLGINPDEYAEAWQVYTDLKNIDIVSFGFGYWLGVRTEAPWVVFHDADYSGLLQDKADRYRER